MVMRRTIRIASLALCLTLGFAAVGLAATPVKAPVAVPAGAEHLYKAATKLPDVFYLGLPGKSGCYVCHGNVLLQKNVKGKMVSYYVDKKKMDISAHKNVACTSCHLNFTSKNHTPVPKDWRNVAGLACIRCHEHKKQYDQYVDSIHGQKALRGQKGATCSDCHGSHDIAKMKKGSAEKLAFEMNSKEVCGKCHEKEWQSYDDYYHGRAYRRGAEDAPSCWFCHGAHNTLPAKEPGSAVSKKNLRKTCEKCHPGSGPSFLDYAPAIHGTQKLKDTNPIYKGKKYLTDMVGGVWSSVTGFVGISDESND